MIAAALKLALTGKPRGRVLEPWACGGSLVGA